MTVATPQARVVDVHSIKPLDVDEIVAAGADTGAVLTIEEHNRTSVWGRPSPKPSWKPESGSGSPGMGSPTSM
jgi:hypothetical protein